MRIYVVVEQSGIWYPQNAIGVLKKTGKFDFVNTPDEADVIWAFSYYQPLENLVENPLAYKFFILFEKLKIAIIPKVRLRRALKEKLVITSVHHLYEPKELTYIHRVRLWNDQADVIQFFSHKNIAENNHYFSKPILFAPYWIDLNAFRPYTSTEKKAVRAQFGIPQGKKIIGSFQRDTDRDGQPKFEKGPDVLCDALEPLAGDNIFVLLAGPRRSYVEGRLTKAGIPFKNVGTVSFDQMNDLYQCLDYYLVTSRCEGGPQAIIECMAGKIPVLSTDVGIATLLNKKVICTKPQEFTDILKRDAYPDVIEEHFQTVQLFDVHKVADDYKKKFEALYESFKNAPEAMKQICADSRTGVDFVGNKPVKSLEEARGL